MLHQEWVDSIAFAGFVMQSLVEQVSDIKLAILTCARNRGRHVREGDAKAREVRARGRVPPDSSHAVSTLLSPARVCRRLSSAERGEGWGVTLFRVLFRILLCTRVPGSHVPYGFTVAVTRGPTKSGGPGLIGAQMHKLEQPPRLPGSEIRLLCRSGIQTSDAS